MTIKMLKSVFLLALLSFASLSLKPAQAQTSPNGEWQYLILRGDTHGVGGRMKNPNCPFYVGYFKLDFRKLEKRNGKYNVKPEDKSFFRAKGNGPMYAVGEQYEMKGSYTHMDDDSQCSNPSTAAQTERAPLIVTKVSSDQRELEWTTDFSQGTEGQNAMWQVKAKYDGKESMEGTLKAYVCDDEDHLNCSLLNTTQFEAKRIKSIQEASNKSLYKNDSPLSTLMKLLLPNYIDDGGVFERKRPYANDESFVSEEEDTKSLYEPLNSEYIKPSLKAMFPAKAELTSATRICQARGGTGNWPCKVCKNVNCAPGQSPTGPEQKVCCFGAAPGLDICESYGCPGGGCKPNGRGKTNCI